MSIAFASFSAVASVMFRSARSTAPAKVRSSPAISASLSNVKGVGAGVYEYRLDFGPGYWIYFGKDGDRLVILLAGGTKKRQQADIKAAKANWQDYKRRKRWEVP